MQKRVLVTGARAPSALEVVRLLKSAGHHVVIAETMYFPISRFSNSVDAYYSVPPARFHPSEYATALRKIIDHEKIDVLIPTCEEIFYISSQMKPEVLGNCFIWCDEFGKLDLLHNKYRFIEYAKINGFQVPKTTMLRSIEEMTEYARSIENSMYVLKPVYSRFASQTKILRGGKDIPKNISPSEGYPWVAQEYIEGRHLCTYSLCLNGELQAHTTYPSQERWGIGASIVFEHIPHPAVEEWVRKFVAKIDFTGQISFDFIEASDGTLYPIECNPRTTSGVHLFRPQGNLIDCFMGERPMETQFPTIQVTRSIKIALISRFFRLLIERKSIVDLKRTWNFICHSDDILSDSKDPLPGFGQFISLGEFIVRGLLVGLSATEVATYDMGYNGRQEAR